MLNFKQLNMLCFSAAIFSSAGEASAEQLWRLKLPFSARCIDINQASTANGGRAIQFDCRNNQTNQAWFLRQVDATYFQIVNRHSGRCLEISEAQQSNNAWAQQWDCNGQNHQQFELQPRGDTSDGLQQFIFKTRHSSKCLTVLGGVIGNGAQIVQFDCDTGTNQYIAKERW